MLARQAPLASLSLVAVCGLFGACNAHDDASKDLSVATPTADLGELDAGSDGDTALVQCTGKSGTPGDSNVAITVTAAQGGNRSYLLHIPPQYDPTVGMPLYVVVHGLTNDAADMRDITHWNVVADERGLLIVYPQGITDAWNGGTCCAYPEAANIDDVGYISAVVHELTSTLCVDDRRIFAAGFSNGGFMVHRLGCEMSDTFAAIGVASGEESLATCDVVRTVSVVQVHGTADPLVPYDGDPLLGFPSTMTTMTGWATRDGCQSTTTPIGTNGSVSCQSWNGCADDSNVVLCTNQGGVHEWVGTNGWVNDMPPASFDTTTYFTDFFTAHPMP